MTYIYLADGSRVDTSDLIATMREYSSDIYPELPPILQSLNCLPDAEDTMTNNVSHLGGFADATNTGAPTEVGLPTVPDDISSGDGWIYDPRGWVQVFGNDAILDGLYIPTSVNVQEAHNAVVQNCVIEVGGNAWGVTLRGAKNVKVLNNTIHGLQQYGPGRLDSGVRDIFGGPANSDPLEIRGNNIYWCSTGIGHVTGGGLIQGNYIHDMGFNTATMNDPIAADHTNGMQSEGATGNLLVIRGNTILVELTQTDAIMLSGWEGNLQQNRLIEHNLLAGGGYTFYSRGWLGETARRIVVRDNHFSRLYYPNSGNFGPVANWEYHPSNLWENNVWDDTGERIELAV